MTLDVLMLCSEVSSGVKQLHEEFAALEVPFSHSVVATDLADIEKHLVAELPVSLRCKECLSDNGNSSEIFYFSQSSFLIVSSQSS